MANLRDELQKIYDQRGRLTPALVVEEATSIDHPLHDRFEWSNSRAADLYRKQQAHELIKSVTVVYKDDDSPQRKEVRAWYSVVTPAGYQYEPAAKVARDPVLIELVKDDMERQWRRLKEKYENFDEFWQMVAADTKKITA